MSSISDSFSFCPVGLHVPVPVTQWNSFREELDVTPKYSNPNCHHNTSSSLRNEFVKFQWETLHKKMADFLLGVIKEGKVYLLIFAPLI